MLHLHEIMNVHYASCDNHFMMYMSQIIMLYTLNLYSAGGELQLNKIGRGKNVVPPKSFLRKSGLVKAMSLVE